MPISYVPSTTTGPVAAPSPRTMRWWRSTLPLGWIGWCVPAMASSGSTSGASTSYSTTMAASARRHVSGWSAATAATGSPA
jgi:hypothetical protein